MCIPHTFMCIFLKLVFCQRISFSLGSRNPQGYADMVGIVFSNYIKFNLTLLLKFELEDY